MSFRKVVLVEFPQPEQWTLAFIVGEPAARLRRAARRRLGHGVRADRAQPDLGLRADGAAARVEEMDVSVDDALKFHVSLGVVQPACARPVRR